MTLEQSIKQSKFKSEAHKAILNIIYTSGIINSYQTRFFKKFDISPQQYNVLRILRGQHPHKASMGLVQERMLDQNSNASRLVEKLYLKNLVLRSECKQDRRQVDLLISENGMKLLSEIDESINDLDNHFNKLSNEEFLQLNQFLDKLNTPEK
ncbi:MAG: MarR family winged helix-turn-helix transcriptional regulator [Bacteroidia bacterium]